MGDDNPLGALIGKNAAEKALQPWWEGIQDLLIYGLIGFGKSSIIINFLLFWQIIFVIYENVNKKYH